MSVKKNTQKKTVPRTSLNRPTLASLQKEIEELKSHIGAKEGALNESEDIHEEIEPQPVIAEPVIVQQPSEPSSPKSGFNTTKFWTIFIAVVLVLAIVIAIVWKSDKSKRNKEAEKQRQEKVDSLTKVGEDLAREGDSLVIELEAMTEIYNEKQANNEKISIEDRRKLGNLKKQVELNQKKTEKNNETISSYSINDLRDAINEEY